MFVMNWTEMNAATFIVITIIIIIYLFIYYI